MKVEHLSKLVFVILALAATGCSALGSDRLDAELSAAVEEARRFDEFDLYWLGEKYEGKRLDSLYRSEPYQRPRNDVTIRYGPYQCDIDSNCVPLLQIHIRPYCDASPEMLSERIEEEGGLRWWTHYQYLTFEPDYREIDIRGVEAWLFGKDTFGVLYLWTGRSALVLSGDGGFSLKKAAQDLRSFNEEDAGENPAALPAVSAVC